MTASDYVSEPATTSEKPNSLLPYSISRASISRFVGLFGTTYAVSALVTSGGAWCIADDVTVSSSTVGGTTAGGT